MRARRSQTSSSTGPAKSGADPALGRGQGDDLAGRTTRGRRPCAGPEAGGASPRNLVLGIVGAGAVAVVAIVAFGRGGADRPAPAGMTPIVSAPPSVELARRGSVRRRRRRRGRRDASAAANARRRPRPLPRPQPAGERDAARARARAPPSGARPPRRAPTRPRAPRERASRSRPGRRRQRPPRRAAGCRRPQRQRRRRRPTPSRRPRRGSSARTSTEPRPSRDAAAGRGRAARLANAERPKAKGPEKAEKFLSG